MSSKKYWIAFFIIIFIAVLLRFYKLGSVPHGITWDEAAIGYNGHAVLTTRRDEWLHRVPFSFRSFGDYKAPAAIYLNGFFTYVFGMNAFAVRLPFAIAAVFAVAGLMLLVKELLEKYSFKTTLKPLVLSLITGVLIALSPWHLHYSRAGFESGMSLSFLIWGILALVWWRKSRLKRKSVRIVSMIVPSLFLVASMYTYHSAKIVVPLLVLALISIYYKDFIKEKTLLLVSFLTSVVLLLPMAYDSLLGEGLKRSETLVFSRESDILKALLMVSENFFAHLKINFLLSGYTDTLRHGNGSYGVLFIVPFIFILVFLIALLYSLIKKKARFEIAKYQFALLAIAWIIIGFIPGAIATEAPHSNRTLLALPGFIFLALLGIDTAFCLLQRITNKMKHQKVIIKIVAGSVIAVYLGIFFAYLNHYYTVFAKESAEAFQDGYLEAFEFIIPYEKGIEGKKQVDKIVFTSEYGQPYIYALFARKTNPIWYQGGSLIKYEFRDSVDAGDLTRENAVVVGGQKAEFLDEGRADKVIYGTDGSVRFKIYVTE